MIRTVTLDRNQKPTKEQIRQIEDAAKREIVFESKHIMILFGYK